MINEAQILHNRKYQQKLSYHRQSTNDFRDQIAEFFETNFNISFPNYKSEFFKYVNAGNETYNYIYENYENLVKTYYTLGNFGESFASLFTNEKGHFETYTTAHIYSKHRLDPVWNYRKSNLIRNIYRQYLKSSKIYEQYHPVHITLTVPHEGGKWQGKRFYVKELIDSFHKIRRSQGWKSQVYAGEYGVEVKSSPNKNNGMHIHIHSLAFLKAGVTVNKFRKFLQAQWKEETEATQIWVETIYFHAKGDNGKYITELIPNPKKLITFENIEDETYTTESEFITVRKKIYVDDFAKQIKARKDITEEQKESEILNAYLYGILETIKYHFKNDSLTLDGKNYDLPLVEEVLQNTKGKRLYSRFGAFYKVPELSFNHLNNETNEGEPMAEATEEVINPFTGETTTADKTTIVMFYPERQKRASKTALEPYKLINYKTDIYTEIAVNKPIKEVLSNYLKNKFPNKKQINNQKQTKL